MKRKFKRIASLILAAVMVFAMAVPAMAEEKKIVINESNEKHQYTAYQIFSGELDSTGKVLSNIKWGTGISETGKKALLDAFLTANAEKTGYVDEKGVTIKEDDLLKALLEKLDTPDVETAKKIARALEGTGKLTGTAAASVNSGPYKMSVPEGYYLIIDSVVGDDGLAADDALSSFIIEVAGNDVDVTPKKSTPTVDKQVHDDDQKDATVDEAKVNDPEGGTGAWGETADHEINETFQFKLKATISDDAAFAEYERYLLRFNDTMSEGLTFDKIDSVTVVVKGKEGFDDQSFILEDSEYIANTRENPWTLEITDIISLLEEKLDTEGFKLGSNVIEVEVLYTAHLNEKAVVADKGGNGSNPNEVTLTYSNNPNNGGEGTGTTKPDTVFVFTYKAPQQKVDGTSEEDPKDAKYTEKVATARFTLYRFDGTKDGNKGAVVNFSEATDEDSKKYYYFNPKGTITELVPDPDNEGMIDIRGLDEGKYVLSETVTPDGYNTCDDIEITITVDENGHKQTGAKEATTSFECSTGELNKIVNDNGTTLPETGGIGTTIFYVVGSVLVLGAVILLVTKRRMKSE